MHEIFGRYFEVQVSSPFLLFKTLLPILRTFFNIRQLSCSASWILKAKVENILPKRLQKSRIYSRSPADRWSGIWEEGLCSKGWEETTWETEEEQVKVKGKLVPVL